MMQAPKTKPTVLIALKFCTIQTLKFSSQLRGFSSPKIILHCFLADLKVHIYESETAYNGEANVTNVKENHSIVLKEKKRKEDTMKITTTKRSLCNIFSQAKCLAIS